jgi:hypothetical protein
MKLDIIPGGASRIEARPPPRRGFVQQGAGPNERERGQASLAAKRQEPTRLIGQLQLDC